MRRPKAETVELAAMVPACTMLVAGVAAVFYWAWGDPSTALFSATVFVVSLMLTVVLTKIHHDLDAAERAAAFHRRMERIKARPGRVTMDVLRDRTH